MRSVAILALGLALAGCTASSSGTAGASAAGGGAAAPPDLDAILAHPIVAEVMAAVDRSDGDEYFIGLQEYVAWRTEHPDAPFSEHFGVFVGWIEEEYGTLGAFFSSARIDELASGEESVAMLIDISIIASALAHFATGGRFPEEEGRLVARVLERQSDARVDEHFAGDGSRRKAMLAARDALNAASH